MDSAWSFLLCETEGLPNRSRDPVDVSDTTGPFGDWLHHIYHIEDLEASLLGLFDRFLAGDHHHWHAS